MVHEQQHGLRRKTLWLAGLLLADAGLCTAALYPTTDVGIYTAALRFFGIGVGAFVVSAITALLPTRVQDVLVFWRLHNPLPGSRAFSELAHGDSKIAVDRLREHVGEFPKDPRKQNELWFRLFDRVRDHSMVQASHVSYLFFHDATVLSAFFLILAPVGILAVGAGWVTAGRVAGVFMIQYLVLAIGARHRGEAFVRNVLALHSAKKIPE